MITNENERYSSSFVIIFRILYRCPKHFYINFKSAYFFRNAWKNRYILIENGWTQFDIYIYITVFRTQIENPKTLYFPSHPFLNFFSIFRSNSQSEFFIPLANAHHHFVVWCLLFMQRRQSDLIRIYSLGLNVCLKGFLHHMAYNALFYPRNAVQSSRRKKNI